jgi:hypothetical protein
MAGIVIQLWVNVDAHHQLQVVARMKNLVNQILHRNPVERGRSWTQWVLKCCIKGVFVCLTVDRNYFKKILKRCNWKSTLLLSLGQLSDCLNWGSRGRYSYTCWKCWCKEPLLFIAKTYSCWELVFATDSNGSESSVDSRSSDNDSDSDLSLAQPLAE